MHAFDTAESFDLPDPRVWVAGDWHGSATWVQTVLPALRRRDSLIRTIVHVGDFWPDDAFARTVDYWAAKAGIERVLVTLGNHEPYLDITPLQSEHPGKAVRVSEVVWLLPRPFRFKIMGRDVLSLGGASSVDRHLRTEGLDWWPDELITDAMEHDAIAGGQADILLTHEAPGADAVPEVQQLLAGNPYGYPMDTIAVSAAQRELIDRVREAVQPEVHFHGHMHVAGERMLPSGQRIISLPHDGDVGNVVVLDVATLDVERLPATALDRRR